VILNRILQPTDYSCGQTCLAMLLNKPVELMFQHLPDSPRGTYVGQLIQVLRHYGVSCDDRLTNGLPKTTRAIGRVIFPHVKQGHWIVLHRGTILDPSPVEFAELGGKIVSHLMIGGPSW